MSVTTASPDRAEQQYRGEQQREHVVGEIEQVDRQEVANPVAVGADAGDQVSGPFAAEKLQGKALQMGIGLVPQVGGDPLAHPGYHAGPGPGQQPRQNRGAGESRQVPPDLMKAATAPFASPRVKTLFTNGLVRYGGIRPTFVLATISTNPSRIIDFRALAKPISR